MGALRAPWRRGLAAGMTIMAFSSSAPAIPRSTVDPVGPPRFSDELRSLVARFADQPACLSDILGATQGRGYNLTLLLIAVPFVGPIPLPGFSLPFGLVVALLGLRQLLDRGPWLPQRVLQRQIPPRLLAGVFGVAGRLMRAVEVVVRPRLGFVSRHQAFSRISGLLTAVAGVMLMLPLPLPFSNSLPAWTVILLSIGALGRDGLFFIAGCGAFLLSAVFFAIVAWGGVEAIEIIQWVFSR